MGRTRSDGNDGPVTEESWTSIDTGRILSYIMRHKPTKTHPLPNRANRLVRNVTPLLAGVSLTGCADVAIWGNVFSMLLTLAIFVGTLSLSREGGPGEP